MFCEGPLAQKSVLASQIQTLKAINMKQMSMAKLKRGCMAYEDSMDFERLIEPRIVKGGRRCFLQKEQDIKLWKPQTSALKMMALDATRGKRLTAALQNQKKSNKCQTVDVLSLYSTINI